MEKPGFRRIRVIRDSDDARGYRRHDRVLVEIPREWARGVVSLIKVSDEYRHGGLLVTNVGPTGQAAIAGVARGDVLLRYDGDQLDSAETLARLASRPMQGGATLEALRGAQELTFKLAGGRLDITVSPLLHSFGPSRRSTTRVIRAWDDEERPHPGESTLVEVPGELVRNVLLLKGIIQGAGTSKQRKKVEALLLTAARMG